MGQLTTVYRQAEADVRELSGQIPIATTEIAKMMTAAARMEVPTGQLKEFTLLASEMEQGLARIITPERAGPLVDRALNAIYRVLQRFTGRTAEAT
jgi:hypothetical protein